MWGIQNIISKLWRRRALTDRQFQKSKKLVPTQQESAGKCSQLQKFYKLLNKQTPRILEGTGNRLNLAQILEELRDT